MSVCAAKLCSHKFRFGLYINAHMSVNRQPHRWQLRAFDLLVSRCEPGKAMYSPLLCGASKGQQLVPPLAYTPHSLPEQSLDTRRLKRKSLYSLAGVMWRPHMCKAHKELLADVVGEQHGWGLQFCALHHSLRLESGFQISRLFLAQTRSDL